MIWVPRLNKMLMAKITMVKGLK